MSFEQPVLELASDETSTGERPLEEMPGELVLGEDVLGLDVRREEVAFEEPVVEEPVVRPGFFARLFGRKPKLAVEEHQFDEPMLDEAIAETPIAEEPVAEESFAEASFGEAPVAEESVAEESFAQELVAEEPPAHAIMDASIEDEEVVNTNEYPVEAAPEATPDETFTSVDEALPLDEESISADLLEPVDSAPVATPEPGFFARLFARKSKPVARPSLEIEVHEDRIEAAAHALDEVSGESFSSAVADRESSQETFASVEEALPSVDEALPLDEALPSVDAELPEPEGATRPIDVAAVMAQDATRPIDVAAIIAQDDQRFAPPAAQESRSTLEIEPFDPFATDRDSRDTVETAEDSRSTVEMQQDARSTVEVAQDFSDTLEIDEKTDEFAVPTLDAAGPTGDVDEGPDTLEVSKQSWIARLLGFRKKEGDKAAATAAVVEGKPNFLFSKFRAFYNEIIRFKHQKTEFTAGFSTAIVTDYTADLSPDSSAEIQSKALMQMLELQAAEAAWMGGEAKARYPDAQYAMAVMADEIFTHIEWEGKEAWPKHLLEVKLYKTHAADMELFNRIDKLLKEQPNSPVARDLARVYLLVIAAGFQGKYRPFGLTRALADYRQRLYEYIHNDDPLMLYAPERKIFPEAESRTLEGHAVSRFTAAQRWAAILVFLLVGYTVMAHFAWNRVAADLKDVTARIRTAGATTGTGSSAPSTTTSNTTGAR